jgi:multicomponent Na+:H+ antiporter subunit G
MRADVIGLVGLFFLWAGVVFSALGVLGLLRFPDVYCRLHASGKVSTLGLCGLLIGAAVIMPNLTLRAVALMVFMLITAPVASHAIGLAAHRLGVPMKDVWRDDLADLRREQAHPGPHDERTTHTVSMSQ